MRTTNDKLLGAGRACKPARGSVSLLMLLCWVALVVPLLVSCGGTSMPLPTPTAAASATTTFTPSATATITPTPTPTFPRDAVVEVSSLNMRAGPNTLHPIVGLLGSGTPVAVNGRSHDTSWLAVRSPDESQGWINTSFVRLRKDEAAIPIVPTPTSPPTPTPTPVPMDPALPLVLLPPIVAQGDPVLVRLRQPGTVQAMAALDDQTTALRHIADDTFVGFLGVPPDIHPGEHAVHVTAIDGDGNASLSQVILIVHHTPFADENIELDEERQKLLDPELRALEEERLAADVWSVDSQDLLWHGAWARPVTGTVSSRYGTQRSYNKDAAYARHLGVDFRARPGTPVVSPARGIVIMAEPLEVFGNSVWIDHGWGMQSGYFHLEDVMVEPGHTVEPGDTIGTVGSTGRVTGPHLHWEVRIQGVPVQPLEFLRRDVGALP